MEVQERYRQNALACCCAAEKLNEDRTDAFIAPTSLCLAFAIELYLKCVLLKAGNTDDDLRGYGHDLWKMWQQPELSAQRQQAVLHAESCFQDLQHTGSSLRPIPKAGTFDTHLKHLSELHTSASAMALRYPKERTMVPSGTLLICVFERLIRNEEFGDSIVRA